jgi:hypothetical protein
MIETELDWHLGQVMCAPLSQQTQEQPRATNPKEKSTAMYYGNRKTVTFAISCLI